MRVLVPVEDPLFAACIVDFIKQHEWPAKTEFLVVNVIEPYILERSSQVTFEPFLRSCSEGVIATATHLVNEVAQAINNAHPQATVAQEVVEAHVTEQIVRMVKKWNADLVVIGSHGRSGFNHFVLGSVSLSLAQALKTPIILVKPDEPALKLWDNLDYPTLIKRSFEKAERLNFTCQPKRVLIALDETHTANNLIEFCTHHKWADNAEFKLLSSIESRSFQLLPEASKKKVDDELFRLRQAKLDEFAHVLRSELRTNLVSTVVETGDARRAILSAAKDWKADLLVVGSHFRNSIGTCLLGSVSLSALCAAPCSVLLVKDSLVRPVLDSERSDMVSAEALC